MKLWASILLYAAVGAATMLVSERAKDSELGRSLFDVVHAAFPEWPSGGTVSALVDATIVYTVVRWWDAGILTLYFLSMSVLLLMRLPAFLLTETPPADASNLTRIEQCRRNRFSFANPSNTCIDNMFSGHTCHVVVGLTLIYLFSKSVVEKVVATVASGALVFWIASSRLHYAADVWVAVCLAPLVVWFLHKR